jgi:hypothetical protein
VTFALRIYGHVVTQNPEGVEALGIKADRPVTDGHRRQRNTQPSLVPEKVRRTWAPACEAFGRAGLSNSAIHEMVDITFLKCDRNFSAKRSSVHF